MAKSSAMTIRIDPEIKAQADNILQYLGMTTSEAVTVFLRQVIINNGIPFPVKAPMPNARLRAALVEADSILEDPDIKGYATIEELNTALDAEDALDDEYV